MSDENENKPKNESSRVKTETKPSETTETSSQKVLEVFDVVDPLKISDDWDAIIQEQQQFFMLKGFVAGSAK